MLAELVRRALDEDAAGDDITTRSTVPAGATGRARLIAREPCVVAGTDAFVATMVAVDPSLSVELRAADGDLVAAGSTVAIVEGALAPILTAERTALNFVQHLSGIATTTRGYVEAAGRARILDTRKTIPGLRALAKAAVRAGGGTNHRADLSAAVLIKDNHIAAAGSIARAVAGARAALPGREVQVECDTLRQLREALDAGVERVLLDNMDPATLREAVALIDGRARAEASGGITLDTIGVVAATGVDDISIGALTHSARAIDLALDVEVL